MLLHVPAPSARTRFIVSQGILRRGSLVGLAVTLVYVWANLGTETFAGAWWRVALVVLLCFAEWALGAGWIVGAVLWWCRQHADAGGADPRSGGAGQGRRT